MDIRDYRETGAIISGDVDIMLSDHPEAFDALLFKAVPGSEENATVVEDVVGSLESGEVRIEYADPIPVRALIVPAEGAVHVAFTDGTGENLMDDADPIVLLLSEGAIPRQSIVRWSEFTGQGDAETRDVSVYILRSAPFGEAPVFGQKHYCIPLPSAGETGEA